MASATIIGVIKQETVCASLTGETVSTGTGTNQIILQGALDMFTATTLSGDDV